MIKRDGLRVRVCSTLVAALLLLQCPAGVFANWGLQVGRANEQDVIRLSNDWRAFMRENTRLKTVLLEESKPLRQMQLLGVEAQGMSPQEIFERAQQLWLLNVLGPLQRIALNPAASCAEARFVVSQLLGIRRQEQLVGLDGNAEIQLFHETTEQMAALRCKDEAFDECVATGRYMPILQLLFASERTSQLLGLDENIETWADEALKQCAIYELHFVSTTKGGHGPMGIETVRDGTITIEYQTPPDGLLNSKGSPEKLFKGETTGGNNPFFVSVKCTSPTPAMELVCSPGADSTPIKVRLKRLDLKYLEFYVEAERLKDPDVYPKENVIVTEKMVPKHRLVGNDELLFEFEGGMFSLQGLIKAPFNTASVPFPDWGNTFYMAHKKDMIGGERSGILLVKGEERGIEPAIFDFKYADQNTFGGALTSDSTIFELIHKPKLNPNPFRKYDPDPIRQPLKPKPNQR